MAIEHIHLSKQAKDQLIKLKRITGIKNWNILCRWAFCISLAESSVPPAAKIPADSSVEMTWKVFGGHYHDIYMALLKERCRQDGILLDNDSLFNQLKLHLHRGIGYLASSKDLTSISCLLKRLHK